MEPCREAGVPVAGNSLSFDAMHSSGEGSGSREGKPYVEGECRIPVGLRNGAFIIGARDAWLLWAQGCTAQTFGRYE